MIEQPPGSIPIKGPLVQRLKARIDRAKRVKDPWLDNFEECYEYALPGKDSMFSQAAGQKRTSKIYDETAVVGVQEFGSRLQAGICPPWSRWSEFEPGTGVPDDDKADTAAQLQKITDYVFDVINGSNFAQEVSEGFLDLAVGTGCLHVDDGDDPNHPIRCSAISLAHYLIDTGPDDSVDFWARPRCLRLSQLRTRYPQAKLTQSMADALERGDDDNVDFHEVIYRDWDAKDETWHFCLIVMSEEDELLKQTFTGIGSCPTIIFRWSKMAGEVWGRGPLLNAMPAIKTCNLTVELILENAEMAVTGMYQVDDDGVVNVNNIQIIPGTVIPVSPGSKITPFASAGSFDVAQLVLQDMRANIKRALYNEMLGNPDKTPLSATEVSARMADLSRQIGASFGRLQTELIEPFLRRVIYLLRRQGRISIPAVNGKEIAIKPTSPLSQAQKHQDVTNVAGFISTIGQLFGPQMVNILVKSEDAAAFIAEKLIIPSRLLRTENERKQIAQMAAMAAQQSAMPAEGAPPSADGSSPPGP